MKKWVLTVPLLLAICAVAQQATTNLQGSWIATAAGGSLVLGGRWSGRVMTADKNLASGSWVLINKSNHVVLEGTWSALKETSGWRGTWSARIPKNKDVSGIWEVVTVDFKGRTLEEMLKRTVEKQIGGSWQINRAKGNWWLQH